MKKYHSLNVRICYFFLILVVLIAVGVGELIYKINYNNSMRYGESLLLRCGKYVDKIVDADNIKLWLDGEANDMYDLTYKDLESMRDVFQIAYLFVIRPVQDNEGKMTNEVNFVFELNAENNSDVLHGLEISISTAPQSSMVKDVLDTGKSLSTTELSTKNEGDLLTVLVPLKLDSGENYAVAVVCSSLERIKKTAVHTSVLMVVVIEIVIALFAACLLFFIHRRITRPVNILSKRMDNFVSSDEKLQFTRVTEIRTHDEIEKMADNFNSMAESIQKYTNDLRDATSASERLRTELDVSKSIRTAVSSEMNSASISSRTDFELYASLKNTVYNSCSFCNYFLADEDHLFIVIGESVGKTLPAMLMSILASTNICALARMGVEPYKIAYETNESLCGFERSSMSMTVSALIVCIELSSGNMKYVNAGMPPIIIKRAGEIYTAENREMQFNLGEMHGVSFLQKSTVLEQGCTLFFTSYGVQEMKNAYGEKFTSGRLIEEINDISHSFCPIKEMTGELERRLDLFRSGAPSELDTTILGLRYYG